MNAKSLIWGIVGTVVWLLIIFLFAVLKGYELPNSLNELGDALAGIVAPIAFFWLILGYLQQSKQLEQNSIAINQQAESLKKQAEALNLQIVEMKESVQQQKELAQIQRNQLENQRKILKPFLLVMETKCDLIEFYADEYSQELVRYLSFKIDFLVKNSDIRDFTVIDSENNVLYSEEFFPKDITMTIGFRYSYD